MTRVYVDHAAASPLRPVARAAMLDAWARDPGNPASAHRAGSLARAILEAAREEVAAAIGAHPLEIVFTSGATEANNLALAGHAAAAGPLRLVLPATEHASVLEPARALAATGHAVTILPVSAAGLVEPAAVTAARPTLLSVALVNAETGVMQDLPALVAAARACGARVHVDAAQAGGVVALDVAALGVDLLTVSGHKIGGPPGTGALWVRAGTALAPAIRGGPQEQGLRAGTENVAGIAGFAAALAAATAERPRAAAHVARLAAALRAGLTARCPDVRPTGGDGDAAQAPHVVHVTVPGLAADALLAALDLAGIAASAGSACAAGAPEPSHVLRAMGRSEADAASALRFSFGWNSARADVEAILAALPAIVAQARTRHQETAWPAHAS